MTSWKAAAKTNYRPDIDGLRGFSILLVLIFHAFPSSLSGGYLGVDVFFVISGFLITQIVAGQLQQGQFSISSFYARRIRRLFPALIAVLAACLIFGWTSLYANEYKQLGQHVFSGSLFFSNFTYLGEAGYFDTGSDVKVLLHLWSLAIEEQFYLLWPLILFVGVKFKINLGKLIFTVLVTSLLYNFYALSLSPTLAFFSPLARSWELAAGAALAFVKLNGQDARFKKLKDNLSVLAGLLILLGLFFVQCRFNFKYSKMIVILPVIGTALLIFTGQGSILNRAVFRFKPLVWCGKLSYPLYLWHWPLLVFLRITNPNNITSRSICVMLLLSFILAWATHKFLEKNFQNLQFRRLKNLALITSMAVLGLIGFVIFKYDGLPERKFAKVGTHNIFGVPNVEKCDALNFQTKGDDYCHTSESSLTDNVLVVGDSHANGFSAILSNYVKTYDFTFIQIGRGSCAALINDPAENCAEVFQKAKEILDLKSMIRTVVMAARWPVYMDQKDFKERFFKTIEYYTARNLKVVIFLTVPNANNPSLCIPRTAQMDLVVDCNTPIKSAIDFERNYRVMITEAKQKFAKIEVLDPWPYLCTDTVCKVRDENGIIYSDVSHVSKYGARLLSQKFETRIAHEILGFNVR